MKNLTFIVALFVILAGTATALDFCASIQGANLYNLCPFAQATTPFTANTVLYETGQISFGIFKKFKAADVATTEAYAYYKNAVKPWQMISNTSDADINLLNSSDPNAGLNMSYSTYSTYDSATKTVSYYNLNVILKCDPSDNATKEVANTTFTGSVGSPVTVLNATGNNTINYTYTATGSSRYGCPTVSLNKIIEFINNNRYIFAAVFGVVGLILTFFGLKLFKVAVFIIAMVLGTLITGSLFFQLTSLGSAQWVLWLVFAASLILGIILGVLAIKLEKIGYFCVGAALGVTGGLLLYNAILSPLLKSTSTIPLYATVVIAGIIGGVIAFYIFESILIIATSLIGSYFVIRVIGSFAGNFPSEVEIAEGIKSFSGITYAYLAGIILLAALGMFVQFKNKKATEKEQDGTTDNYYNP